LLALRSWIETKNGDIASTARPQAFQNLNRGGFAGSIRPEQSEDLAGVDFEIDALDGLEAAIALCERFNLNDWGYAPSLTRLRFDGML